MCNEENGITVHVNEENGEVSVRFKSWGVWDALPKHEQEDILREVASWDIMKDALKYKLGKGVSSPNYNPSIHKLREMILTDSELVSDILVEFITTLLDLLGSALQDQRATNKAYRSMRNWVTDNVHRRPRFTTPLDTRKEIEPEHFRISNDDVKADILEKFGDLLGKVTS